MNQYGSLIAFGKKFDSYQKTNCPEQSQLADQRDALITEFNQHIQNLENSVRDQLSKDRGNRDTQDLRSVGKKIVEAQEGTVLINIFVADNKTWVLGFQGRHGAGRMIPIWCWAPARSSPSRRLTTWKT